MIYALICFLMAAINIPFMLEGHVINKISFGICAGLGIAILAIDSKY